MSCHPPHPRRNFALAGIVEFRQAGDTMLNKFRSGSFLGFVLLCPFIAVILAAAVRGDEYYQIHMSRISLKAATHTPPLPFKNDYQNKRAIRDNPALRESYVDTAITNTGSVPLVIEVEVVWLGRINSTDERVRLTGSHSNEIAILPGATLQARHVSGLVKSEELVLAALGAARGGGNILLDGWVICVRSESKLVAIKGSDLRLEDIVRRGMVFRDYKP